MSCTSVALPSAGRFWATSTSRGRRRPTTSAATSSAWSSEYCWGSCWSGNGLSRGQRSLNNLCILATLNRMEEFELHLRGALRNGCTLEEIRETLIQVAVYAGVPAGVSAFRAAKGVLAEEGVEVSLAPRA